MQVLLMASEGGITRSIQLALIAARFAVETIPWSRALQTVKSIQCDVVLFDLNRSFTGGIALLQTLRRQGLATPIIVFNGCDSAHARIRLLEAGADQCVVDPVSIQELVIQACAVLRRASGEVEKLRVADLELDYVRRSVTRSGKQVTLTTKEFAVLEYLMRNAGRPINRSMIMDHVWGQNFDGLSNVVDVYINYLRAKIDRGFDTKVIRTAYGMGYEVVNTLEKAA
jgi:DNA-binding response OmpR family regulator